MNHYQRSLVLDATPQVVYAALTTTFGLRGWWSEDCDIDAEVGGTLGFRFGANWKTMRIEHLSPGREVRWLCTGAHIAALVRPDEWVGTRLVFRLQPEGLDGTRLDFEHLGLQPTLGCYDLCSKGWDSLLDSLQLFTDTGRGAPLRAREAMAVAS